jgi:hypothetical protein
MAVTEPRETQPVSGPPTAGGPAGTARRRHGRWWGWLVGGLSVLLVTAFVVLAVLAGRYQPIRFGGEWGGGLAGLPAGTGLRTVNTFGSQPGEIYVPPQLGAFTQVESIANTGPEAVTILAVSIVPPQDQGVVIANGPSPPWPLVGTGRVLGAIETFTRVPDTIRPAAGLSLGPGQVMRIWIPMRLNGTCYETGSWSEVESFYVEERYLTFTHWVAVPLGIPLTFLYPEYPGQVPAKDLTCPTKH